jgi:hypothetical protein
MPSTSTSNGKKLTYKPTKGSGDLRPSLPAGHWLDSEIAPASKFVPGQTKAGDPMLTFPIKMGKPGDDMPEENESFKGAEHTFRIIIYSDDDKRTGAVNFARRNFRSICEAVGADYDEVYPKQMKSSDDWEPVIEALAGKTIENLWSTVQERKMDSGEKVLNVDLRFTEPAATASSSGDAEEEEEPEAPARGKAAKKSSRR